jgi:hypothetical protein
VVLFVVTVSTAPAVALRVRRRAVVVRRGVTADSGDLFPVVFPPAKVVRLDSVNSEFAPAVAALGWRMAQVVAAATVVVQRLLPFARTTHLTGRFRRGVREKLQRMSDILQFVDVAA